MYKLEGQLKIAHCIRQSGHEHCGCETEKMCKEYHCGCRGCACNYKKMPFVCPYCKKAEVFEDEDGSGFCRNCTTTGLDEKGH